MKTYGKALMALLFAAITVLHTALSDGHVTPTEGVQIAIAVATAAGVWLVPTHPEWPWGKTVVAAILAGLNILATVIVHGISAGDLTEIALAVLTALGVGLAPAASTLVKRGAGGSGKVRLTT